ncbi:MAG: transcription-repair coupling factor [Clostridium sp.]|nr:transcription-repair coupling factor [Clostridium sp.]MCM1399716.1 transcription-repair coupling factor [Clostridium sp.]MCM1460449.1 transcription-repair coupling factor [Bacteroides sp.]
MQAMIAAFEENPGFVKLQDSIDKNKFPIHAWGLDYSIAPLLMETVKGGSNSKLIVVADEKKARDVVRDYKFFDRNVFYYPAKDLLFYYADIHNNTTVKNRIEIFRRLAMGEPTVVVTTIEGLMDKLPPLDEFMAGSETVSTGDTLDLGLFSEKLTTLGYEKVTMVETPGQFSVRGGIIDIYPLTEECPYRVELWGDDISSIRSFDVESQRSIEEVSSVTICPSSEMVLTNERIEKGIKMINQEYKKQSAQLKKEFRTEQYARLKRMVETTFEELKEFNSTMGLDSMVEYFYDDTVSFLDYFPKDAFVYVLEPDKVERQATVYTQEFAASMEGRLLGGYVLPTQANVIYDGKSVLAKMTSRCLILMSSIYLKQPRWKENQAVGFSSKDILSYNNSFESLMKDIGKWRKNDYRIIIVSPSATRAKRIAANLRDNDITAHYSEAAGAPLKKGEIVVVVGRMESGFELPDSKLIVISESDIFTEKEVKKGKKKVKYAGDKINSFADLSVGDYVVHENHGVGIYKGIEKVKTDGRLKDYISVEYAKGSKLFVPVEQFNMIGKLSGKDGVKPKLNRLGGAEWHTVRQRVKGHVDDIAKELLDLYAARKTLKGFSYSPDTTWQKEFEELFPYEETIDQQHAIDDTKSDMESDGIMDRLICGDVGFGKTEVAIRAAFKAVQDNRQVAYLVPTTILAEQHYDTFTERMKDFPINIRMLSRFCTAAEIKQTIADLKSGQADIVIGTHRLLSKDVQFKNLGLLIIDEEQRFGVKHKETIKQMKRNVDVLTLTATPIPRTLHMSLVGLRDISLLEEAPVDRMPIQTYIMEYDIEFVKEAVNRELNRGGQVYYVYNRVNTIEDITAELRAVLPNANVQFAHGKMNERELEEVMRRFIRKEIDVLVSTTIIETGLDIPNVNTIIIHDADNFGLSQLYQLRGRVGRSNRSAYAFLLYKRDKMIKEVAEKRLKAIREYTELGSGYKISMKDLEIRGAGNLLGQEQSGNIEAVGYDLYCKMLNDAIKRLSGEETATEFDTAIELPVDAYIPDAYVKNEYVKLDLYRRISRCDGREDNDAIIEEVKDRFGEPPKELLRLLDVAYLKSIARRGYITDIKYLNGELKLYMLPTAPVKTERIDMLLKRYQGALRFVAEKQSGFALKTSSLIQDELIDVAERAINDIMLLIE